MDPIFFSVVSTGTKTVQALQNFVKNELGELLQELGDAQVEEAKKSLRRAAQSKDEKDERSNIRDAANTNSI
jgi:hypothetical protein